MQLSLLMMITVIQLTSAQSTYVIIQQGSGESSEQMFCQLASNLSELVTSNSQLHTAVSQLTTVVSKLHSDVAELKTDVTELKNVSQQKNDTGTLMCYK